MNEKSNYVSTLFSILTIPIWTIRLHVWIKKSGKIQNRLKHFMHIIRNRNDISDHAFYIIV